MSNENARNVIDANTAVTFSLSATTGTAVKSSTIDLGSATVKPENVELVVIVPAIAAAAAASGGNVTVALLSSTSSTLSTVAQTLSSKDTTAGSTGTSEITLRTRLPSNCAQYVGASVNVTTGTGSATAATYTATVQLLY